MIKHLQGIFADDRVDQSRVYSHGDSFVKNYVKNPELTWLISFPRTGSHWLRMMMEFYFEKPSLVLIYKYKDARDFTCYHWHDPDLQTTNRKNVIYLYRNPVDTIYSQMMYEKEYINDNERIVYWVEEYGKNLGKWLLDENFTERKTVVTYENLKESIYTEFKKICDHFEETFDPLHLDNVLKIVSKERVKQKTKHNNQVINLSTTYVSDRKNFKTEYTEFIMRQLYKFDNRLKEIFTSNA